MIGANYKRILVGVFGLFILAGIGVQAQEKVNQTDSQGKRHGVWRKNHEASRFSDGMRVNLSMVKKLENFDFTLKVLRTI